MTNRILMMMSKFGSNQNYSTTITKKNHQKMCVWISNLSGSDPLFHHHIQTHQTHGERDTFMDRTNTHYSIRT